MKRGIFVLALLLLIPFSLAQQDSCDDIITSTTAQGLLSEINSINGKLDDCHIIVPGPVKNLVGRGNVLITVEMNSGETNNFYITIDKGRIVSVSEGTPSKFGYQTSTTEATLDEIMNSEDIVSAILSALNEDEIDVDAKGFWNNIKWFFGKFFIPKP